MRPNSYFFGALLGRRRRDASQNDSVDIGKRLPWLFSFNSATFHPSSVANVKESEVTEVMRNS